MNGINAPKVVECLGSDGHKYKQLAKSGNDDLRQDAVKNSAFYLIIFILNSTILIACLLIFCLIKYLLK